ncbi:MXAN_6640 family putative metalloprotease [Nocardioides sp. Bht2]|uniref:MXAN_6640 family putative metalloprotease n=1 Tax=Nocardioides sp. Bht2 TaxID=3392297 RepID=UPI0039B65D26
MRLYSGLIGLTATTALSLVIGLAVAPSGFADEGASPAPVGSSSATPEPDAPADVDDPADVEDPTAAAQEALAEIEELLTETGTQAEAVEVTTALATLSAQVGELPRAERAAAQRLLARPTDPNASTKLLRYPADATIFTTCGAQFCLHWTETTQHRPPGSDGNGATVPAWVQTTQQVLESSWSKIVGDLGYRRPDGDGTRGNPAGVNRTNLVDVYLGNIGRKGMYGYATLDGAGAHQPGYLVLDNDFAEFERPALESLKVTAAHEFFHLVQFGYLRTADAWLMEATATWIEEVVHDAVNDNRQYLAMSSLRRPRTSLDEFSYAAYGNWVFFEFLSKRYGRDVVKKLWVRLSRNKTTGLQAIERTLKARRGSLATEFLRFATASNAPQRFYSEGSAYPKAHVTRTVRIGTGRRSAAPASTRLNHLTSVNHAFVPQGRLNTTWRLRVAVNTPSKDVRARVLVHRKNGSVKERTITIRKGRGSARVAFNTTNVRKVTVTLANTSHAFRCRTGTRWTCQGTPLKDRQAVTLRANLVR